MNWEFKFAEAAKAAKDNLKLGMVFDAIEPADPSFIADLKASHPYLDDDYLQFLSITNGAQIWWYIFAGSRTSTLATLESLQSRWRPNIIHMRLFPIAEDPGGACIAMTQDRRIVQFDHRAESKSDLIELASCFSDFLNDVLMGEKFYSLFNVDSSELKDNEWLDFMKSKGWVAADPA